MENTVVSKTLLSFIDQLGVKKATAKLREEIYRTKGEARLVAYNARKPLTSAQWNTVKFPAFVRVKWKDGRPDTVALIANRDGEGIVQVLYQFGKIRKYEGRVADDHSGIAEDQVVEYIGSVPWPDVKALDAGGAEREAILKRLVR